MSASVYWRSPWLVDEAGRSLILRGVNLGGSSKVPRKPAGSTPADRDGFFAHREVSFVGRPFPLDEADEHFRRLAAWGLHFLRFVITWEAVEHGGPGQYDEAYLDYLHAVIERAHGHGLRVYIDPHQDVWSRFSGGDGAPGWTLEAVGFDLRRLHATGAAFVQQLHDGPPTGLIWPSNATKLAAATMFTLFFGGSDFAPQTIIDGESVQTYLQRHYAAALRRVALRLRDLPNVIGFGSMNEPLPGFIGLPLNVVPAGMLKKGLSPTPYQAMVLGAGHPHEVEVWEMSRERVGQLGTTVANPDGLRAWAPGRSDIWKQHGVWTEHQGKPQLSQPDYFTHRQGREVQFERDYLKPFCQKLYDELRTVAPTTLFFIEGPPVPYGKSPPFSAPHDDVSGLVHAPHWYDGLTLFTKHYNREFTLDITAMMPVFGAEAVRLSFAKQLAFVADQLPGLPALIGEFGLNYDLDGGICYRTGVFPDQTEALDGYYRAVEANLLSCTQWNYTSDNTNADGDQWNGEDLSIWSRDQQREPANLHSGGRALEAIVRPYAAATAGQPLHMAYDRLTRTFTFRFRQDPAIVAPTEIFVPDFPYPSGVEVEVSDGTFKLDPLPGLLRFHPTDAQPEHTITIRPR